MWREVKVAAVGVSFSFMNVALDFTCLASHTHTVQSSISDGTFMLVLKLIHVGELLSYVFFNKWTERVEYGS